MTVRTQINSRLVVEDRIRGNVCFVSCWLKLVVFVVNGTIIVFTDVIFDFFRNRRAVVFLWAEHAGLLFFLHIVYVGCKSSLDGDQLVGLVSSMLFVVGCVWDIECIK